MSDNPFDDMNESEAFFARLIIKQVAGTKAIDNHVYNFKYVEVVMKKLIYLYQYHRIIFSALASICARDTPPYIPSAGLVDGKISLMSLVLTEANIQCHNDGMNFGINCGHPDFEEFKHITYVFTLGDYFDSIFEACLQVLGITPR